MSEFNKHLCQRGFEKYSSGLREEVFNMDFDSKQDIVNYTRSKLNKLYQTKSKQVFHKEHEILKLKNELEQTKAKLEKAHKLIKLQKQIIKADNHDIALCEELSKTLREINK